MFDLIVRGGTIVDGTGCEPFVGDVAIADGRVAAVGEVEGEAREEIDATGRIGRTGHGGHGWGWSGRSHLGSPDFHP